MNTVVLWEKVLEDDALVLPIRGVFRWNARVETVPATIHAVHIVVRVFAGALRPNGRPRTPIEFLAKGCSRLPVVRVLLPQPVFCPETSEPRSTLN